MTTAMETWSNETGFWTVTDEYEYVWNVVTTGDRAVLIQREDSQRFYGAVWTGTEGKGEIHEANEGDEAEGYDCNQKYMFSQTNGWTEVM